MTTHTTRVVEDIRRLDQRLLVDAERLRRYRALGVISIVQEGVVNRMLDERLDLMRERDR